MVAEHWLLLGLILVTMASANQTMFGNETMLGNFFKLTPPPETEVTPENWPEWHVSMKNYCATFDFTLFGIMTELETQKTKVTEEQILTKFNTSETAADVSEKLQNERKRLSMQLYFFLFLSLIHI